MVSRDVEMEARRLHAEAIANRTPKPPRVIGAVTTYSDGRTRMGSMSQVSWRDYIPEARRNLAA